MGNKALGLIETIGLTAATEAADAALKSANVTLIGYENTKGLGMITVKIEGDVGAVKAAVAAAEAAANKVGRVCAVLVIPRPSIHLDTVVYSKDTVGLKAQVKEATPAAPEQAAQEIPEVAKPPQQVAEPQSIPQEQSAQDTQQVGVDIQQAAEQIEPVADAEPTEEEPQQQGIPATPEPQKETVAIPEPIAQQLPQPIVWVAKPLETDSTARVQQKPEEKPEAESKAAPKETSGQKNTGKRKKAK